MLHSLAWPYTKIDLKKLVSSMVDSGHVIKFESRKTLVVYDKSGNNVLSAIKPNNMWCVQVSKNVAYEFDLMLWKDTITYTDND